MQKWTDYEKNPTLDGADEVMILDTESGINKRVTLQQMKDYCSGKTITSTETNSAGHLIITYSDGNRVDVGKITGDTVQIDASLTIQGAAADAKIVGDQIKQITQQMEDLQYVPIEILSFSNNVGIAELGSSVNEITLTWKLNKIPKSATLNNISISGELKADQSVTIRDAALTTDSIFTLAVTDEKNKTVQKKSSIAFYNGVYYGSAIIPTELDSSFIRTLSKSLQSGRVKTFSIDSGADQYVWYALPARYGTPVFNVGGFDGGFAKVNTISFVNLSGYTEEYAVYRSDNSNIGKKTVKVA